MMVKRKANLDDGCNPELVAGAVFDGELEIPVFRKTRFPIPNFCKLHSISYMSGMRGQKSLYFDSG